MQTIGIFKLKSHCSEILKEVASGQEICVTNKNNPVAYIIPKNKYNILKGDNEFKKLFDLKRRINLGTLDEIISMRDEGKMNLVLDCSFAMSSILRHEDRSKSEIYNDIISNKYNIFAPPIFYLECQSVLYKALYKYKKINQNEYDEYIDVLNSLPIRIDNFSSTSESLYSIRKVVKEYFINTYDASYLELAIRLNAKLATFDMELEKAYLKAMSYLK